MFSPYFGYKTSLFLSLIKNEANSSGLGVVYMWHSRGAGRTHVNVYTIESFRLMFTLNVDIIKRLDISRDTLKHNVHRRFTAFLKPGATCQHMRYPLASFPCHKVLFNVW